MCFILEVSVYMANNGWLNLPLITSCLLISEGFSPSNTSLLTSCCQLGGSISKSFSNCSSSLWLSPKAMLSNLRKQTNRWQTLFEGFKWTTEDLQMFCVCSYVYGCTYIRAYGGQRLALGVFLHFILFDMALSCLAFYIGIEHLNWGPHTCGANILPAELLPSPR